LRLATLSKANRYLSIVLLFCLSLNACSFIVEQKTVRYIKYTVARGDTLLKIAVRFNVAISEIVEINDLDSANPLQAGGYVRIPYRGQILSKEDQATVANKIIEKPVAQEKSVATVKLSGAMTYVGKLKWPVETEGKVTSRFGRRWFKFHEGIDIADAEGTPILAAHSGEVVYSGSGLSGYGNLVVIKAKGLLTVYGHNKKNRVRVGDKVSKGDWIADLGSTGHATGPHCHFETRVKSGDDKNIAVDPMAFFP
jgi:murein DD-endopeptidase MepM/ murein hydrolase activator NlpD